MRERLFHEILMARQRVYAAGDPTPLERLRLPLDGEVFLKREDRSPIHAYKWRGAYNRMALLTADERTRGVICASAGNHAQGVALAARKIQLAARIVMPVSTPRMKQAAVRHHGGPYAEVVLHGDSYDDAYRRARAEADELDMPFIHPYDDFAVMGGQGTLADEIVMSGRGPFDLAYLQIGGGGMAAAVACWLRAYYPAIHIVGVEGTDQASMAAAFRAGGPVTLDYVDIFSDGTAVKRVGDLTYPLCRQLLDELITVSNEELCAAIQLLWETRRCVPEPAGAMGLAGLLKQRDTLQGRRALCIICGANMDFGRLAWIARHAGIGAARRHYLRIEIPERRGAFLQLLDTVMENLNIIEFQYGKLHPRLAWPVVGLEATALEIEALHQRLAQGGYAFEDVTSAEDVEFRIINYEPKLFQLPYFIKLEFPERAGALRDFLADVRDLTSICYFNYAYTGENVGRALLGFEFESVSHREAFLHWLRGSGRAYAELDAATVERIL